MLDFLELEEKVGRAWHRLAGDTASEQRFPAATVTLAAMRPLLGPYFRALGGDRMLAITPARAETGRHRLNWRQHLGLGEERLTRATRDQTSLLLPADIALFPETSLNRDLYLWLAALLALDRPLPATPADPLIRDRLAIETAAEEAQALIIMLPGLAPLYRRLARAYLLQRRRAGLPRAERAIEALALHHLQQAANPQDTPSAAPALPERAPPGYLPFLPVPLWPERRMRAETPAIDKADAPTSGAGAALEDSMRRAERETADPRRQERSPFILNRFEKILSLSEMISVDRPTDDSDDEAARTADELDEMVIGERQGKPAARFRFDLDLPPEAVSGAALTETLTYPEWDYRRHAYLADHCRVVTGTAATDEGPLPVESEATRRLIGAVRRQFEVLRPGPVTLRAQPDGAELDLDALVRARADCRAGGEMSDRVHLLTRPAAHDLAVTLLVDVSLSTDSWTNNRRVLDVEKEALQVMARGLAACGDRFEILTFTSRRRDFVRVETVKGFDEPVGSSVLARIAALKPGYYTRMGAAIRHAGASLARQPNRRKLLLVLTDGKPNDVDHYEGRFALEDSRKAVQEARRLGLSVFGVTIDREAKSWLPALFGPRHYRLVPDAGRLPAALPAIYRSLVG